jgi:HK97 family phage prohead protease
MAVKPKSGTIEYRYFERSSGAPSIEGGTLSGRAAPFNTQTMIGKKPWGFREKIAPGAFSKSVNDGDVVLLDNHDTAKPIARQSAGTLKLVETKGGLDWDAIPANTTYANDVRENAKAGNYGGCSFGFEVVNDSWHYNKDDDVDERTLHEVKLHEISVVTFPAYTEGTTVSARDQVDAAKEARTRYYMREYLDLYVVDGVERDEDDEPIEEFEEDERGGNAPGNGGKPYGNVTYADPGYQKDKKKRYPIDTKAHAKAALAYISKASNASAYSSSQLASIKSKIMAACKKFGVKTAAASGKSSADLDTENRVSKEIAAKTAVEKVAVKNLTRTRDLHKEIVRACLDPDIEDEKRGAHVLGLIANFRLAKLDDIRLNKVGTSVQTDGDSDDPICKACHGSGKLNDGSGLSDCPGCGGVGRHTGGGDQTGAGGSQGGKPGDSTGSSDDDKKGSDFGLGIDGKNTHPATPANVGTGKGDGDNPAIPSNKGPQVGGAGAGVDTKTGLKVSQLNEKDFDGETREDGQPDTSTDPDEDDATRYLRAVARKRRMQSEPK